MADQFVFSLVDWIVIIACALMPVCLITFIVDAILNFIRIKKNPHLLKGTIYVVSKDELKEGSNDECYLSLSIPVEELKELKTAEFEIEVIE